MHARQAPGSLTCQLAFNSFRQAKQVISLLLWPYMVLIQYPGMRLSMHLALVTLLI
jgi:hypothetical protein